MILLFLFCSGLGLEECYRHLRAITERQVTLDRCTGAFLIRLKRNVRLLEASFQRIEAARSITLPLLVTPAGPEALESFKLLVETERIIQSGLFLAWKKEKASWDWLPGLGCKIHNHPSRTPYPENPFKLAESNSALTELGTKVMPSRGPDHYQLRAQVAKLSSSALLSRSRSHTQWSTWWNE